MPSLRIALAQLNLFVGDVAGNTQRVIDTSAAARDQLKADLILFPELTLCGYPPEDLLFHKGLRRQVNAAMERVRAETPLGVWGLPEDVAAAALWLARPASGFITGQTVRVNGGAIRAGDWKLIVGAPGSGAGDGEKGKGKQDNVELYNLKDDPGEKKNLAADEPRRVKKLRESYLAYAKAMAAPKAKPKPKDFQSPKVWGED